MAGEHWICLRGTNFELYTTSNESAGREALVYFEQVRRAFTEILGLKLPNSKPVTIIAFRDEPAFIPYRPQPTVIAYSLFGLGRDYIVMQDLVPEHYPVALHEYTHVVVEQAGMKLPVWLDEGFAEVYSTMKPVGRKILVGRIITPRLQTAQNGLLDLREVLTADHHSRLYHETNRTGVFYAESWALVHMLKFSDAYSPRFDKVLDAIGRGEPSDRVLETVYNKPLAQIQMDLFAYVNGNRFREGVIDARLSKAGPEPQLVDVDPLDIAVLLAGIKARGPQREDAVKSLEALANENPGKARPLESLTWIQLGSPDWQAALQSFRRALEAGTRDANLCYQFAINLRSKIPEADYLAALRRATEIDPDFSAAQQQLAAHAFNAGDYPEAVARLHQVKKLGRTQAFMYYRALAFASLKTGNLTEAKAAAVRTQQYAVSAEEKGIADDLLKFLNSRSSSSNTPAPGGKLPVQP